MKQKKEIEKYCPKNCVLDMVDPKHIHKFGNQKKDWEKELKVMKEKAKAQADLLEQFMGQRSCKICGHTPEQEVDFITSQLDKVRKETIENIAKAYRRKANEYKKEGLTLLAKLMVDVEQIALEEIVEELSNLKSKK